MGLWVVVVCGCVVSRGTLCVWSVVCRVCVERVVSGLCLLSVVCESLVLCEGAGVCQVFVGWLGVWVVFVCCCVSGVWCWVGVCGWLIVQGPVWFWVLGCVCSSVMGFMWVGVVGEGGGCLMLCGT